MPIKMRGRLGKFKSVLIFAIITSVSGCFSISRVQVIQNSEEEIKTVSSFYLYPVQLGPTLSDTSEISRKLNDFHEQAKQKFTEKGYVIGPVKSADSLIKISIRLESTGAATDEEIRMMKGSHQSNFPDANPRLRSLEADYLKFEFTRIENHSTFFEAKCLLFENQDALAPAGSVNLTPDNLTYCLDQLIEALPSRISIH